MNRNNIMKALACGIYGVSQIMADHGHDHGHDNSGDSTGSSSCRKWIWQDAQKQDNPLDTFCEDWQAALNVGLVLVAVIVVISILVTLIVKILGITFDVLFYILCCKCCCSSSKKKTSKNDPLLGHKVQQKEITAVYVSADLA